MQIILLEKVTNLGNLGDVVRVKDGFARNFLIPQRKARRATEAAIADFATRRAELEKLAAEKLAAAEAVGAVGRRGVWRKRCAARGDSHRLGQRRESARCFAGARGRRVDHDPRAALGEALDQRGCPRRAGGKLYRIGFDCFDQRRREESRVARESRSIKLASAQGVSADALHLGLRAESLVSFAQQGGAR